MQSAQNYRDCPQALSVMILHHTKKPNTQIIKTLVKKYNFYYNEFTIQINYKGECDMKKRTTKALLTTIMLLLTLSVTAFLTGCGGTTTLEDYINGNKDEKTAMDEEIDKANNMLSQSGMTASIDIKENTITYKYKFDQTFDDTQIDAAKEYMQQYVDAMSLEDMAKTFEEKSKIEGISIRVVCVDGNETEIFSTEYKAKE